MAANPPLGSLKGVAFAFSVLLMWAGFAVYLAGIAKANGKDICVNVSGGPSSVAQMAKDYATKQMSEQMGEGLEGLGRRMLSADRQLLASDTSKDCASALALHWWSIWFQFLCCILATGLWFDFFTSFRKAAEHYVSMVTVLVMVLAHAWVSTTYQLDKDSIKEPKEIVEPIRVVTAGTIILMIGNMFWILVNSTVVPTPVHVEAVAPAKY